MTKKIALIFFGVSHALPVSKYRTASLLKYCAEKHSNCFFYQFFLNFPHNITIFALRYNKKANIR